MSRKKEKSIFKSFKEHANSKEFLFFYLVIFVMLFSLIKKCNEPQLEDFSETLKAKGIVYSAKLKKKGKYSREKYFQYRFEHNGYFYIGEVKEKDSRCVVGDSCIIRFAKENPSVNSYYETIPNSLFSQ